MSNMSDLATKIELELTEAANKNSIIKTARDSIKRYREWMTRRNDTVWTHLRRAEEHALADRYYSARTELVAAQRMIEGMIENVDRMHQTHDMLDELTR